MGDGAALKVSSAYESAPVASGGAGRTSLHVTYTGRGEQGWAGIYWLTPANNWGTMKGAGFDLSAAKRLTFWIRGETGKELLSEVAVGGISAGSYPDSDRASIGPVRLSTQWEEYAINLDGKDLRHIVGGFVFMVRQADNPTGARFYLDEIVFEPAVVSSAPAVVDVSTATEAPVLIVEPVRKVIPFASAKTAFGNEGMATLNEIITLAKEIKAARLTVEGHTDTVGTAAVNLRLSEERARTVANYLTTHGVEATRVSVIGYGEDRPLVPEDENPEAARPKNRRVEIVVGP